jgi:uncharacterized membrane protein SirB2
MIYTLLKLLHTAAALVTISGFLLRGYWMLVDSPLLQARMTKIAPHVLDALLLLAGIAMLSMLHLNPFTQSWLLAKFAGLLVYIVLGSIALKRGKTKQTRAVAFVGAVAAFAYVIGVAVTKSPLGWVASLI